MGYAGLAARLGTVEAPRRGEYRGNFTPVPPFGPKVRKLETPLQLGAPARRIAAYPSLGPRGLLRFRAARARLGAVVDEPTKLNLLNTIQQGETVWASVSGFAAQQGSNLAAKLGTYLSQWNQNWNQVQANAPAVMAGKNALNTASDWPDSANASLAPWMNGLMNLKGIMEAVSAPVPPTALSISTGSLPGGAVGTAYQAAITASGGVPPYSFAATGGALPPGLSLAENGAITGIPTAEGTFAFSVNATDGSTVTAPKSFSIAVGTAGTTPATGGDNTLLYVIGGVGAVALLGAVGWMIFKK